DPVGYDGAPDAEAVVSRPPVSTVAVAVHTTVAPGTSRRITDASSPITSAGHSTARPEESVTSTSVNGTTPVLVTRNVHTTLAPAGWIGPGAVWASSSAVGATGSMA